MGAFATTRRVTPAYEPRSYSVTVEARPSQDDCGRWRVGDVTVRVKFYCSAATHVLRWPDDHFFDNAADAAREAYVEGLHWARARYG
jgi:hypothetical protein